VKILFLAAAAAFALGGCMTTPTPTTTAARDSKIVHEGITADDKEVTARNLTSCKQQAEAARMSADSPPYSRFVEECMQKAGVVQSPQSATTDSATGR
jgi:hypothetical protein